MLAEWKTLSQTDIHQPNSNKGVTFKKSSISFTMNAHICQLNKPANSPNDYMCTVDNDWREPFAYTIPALEWKMGSQQGCILHTSRL
jgi:hypothetical protein